MHIKDNNNSPHGKFHRFLFPFSSKFPDLNFAQQVLYIYSCHMKPVRGTNTEPGLPVVRPIHLYVFSNSGKDDKNAAKNRSKAERFAKHLCYVDDI